MFFLNEQLQGNMTTKEQLPHPDLEKSNTASNIKEVSHQINENNLALQISKHLLYTMRKSLILPNRNKNYNVRNRDYENEDEDSSSSEEDFFLMVRVVIMTKI